MNANISNSRPAKAAVVISIRQLRAILKQANASSKSSSAHPGKINLNHCVALEWDLLNRNFDHGAGHLCSSSLKVS